MSDAEEKNENEQKDANLGSPNALSSRDIRARFRGNAREVEQTRANLAAQQQSLTAQAAQIQALFTQLQQVQTRSALNIEAIGATEVNRAEARDIFATLFVPLTYRAGRNVPDGRLDDGVYRNIFRTWESFRQKYDPKLSENVNIPKWILSYENACELYDMPLEFRYYRYRNKQIPWLNQIPP